MISVEQHAASILSRVSRLEPTVMQVTGARGMVLAEDVVSAADVPGFDNSAMDGYAVRASDVEAMAPGSPVALPVVADIPAGDPRSLELPVGAAARIMTGAPLPSGADTVIPVEFSDGGMEQVRLEGEFLPGRHCRRRGEDVTAGQVLLRSGTRLGPRQMALCAAAGAGQVTVIPPPRVVVMVTGDELVQPGRPVGPGQVVDSNGAMTAALLRDSGMIPYRVGGIKDHPDAILEELRAQLVRADAVITTGGVSMGAYDAVKAALSALGTVDFHQVAMQPGKPQGFGTVGDPAVPLFALPGNPVSVYVSYVVFVAPTLRVMAGREPYEEPLHRAVAEHTWSSPPGKVQFARARVRYDVTPPRVSLVGQQGSHLLGGLAEANALAVVPAEATEISVGMEVSCIPLDGAGAATPAVPEPVG